VAKLLVRRQLRLRDHTPIHVRHRLGLRDERGQVLLVVVGVQPLEPAEPLALVHYVRQHEQRSNRVEHPLVPGLKNLAVGSAAAPVVRSSPAGASPRGPAVAPSARPVAAAGAAGAAGAGFVGAPAGAGAHAPTTSARTQPSATTPSSHDPRLTAITEPASDEP